MPDQLLRSAYIASEGPLVLDGETLIGIIVKDTYVFSTAHTNASEVTAYEVEPASTESRLTGTCTVILNDAETAWLPLVTDTTAVDLSDVEDRGGIVWVRPGASDAVRKIIGWAADPGPDDAAYLPTWPDGLYAELIAPFDAMSADSTVAGVPFVDGDVDAEDLAAALAAFIGSGGTTVQSIDKTGETPGVVNIDLSTGADAVADDVAVVAIMGPSGGDCEFVVTPPVRLNGLALGIYAYCPGHFATITIPASGPLDEVSYGPVVVPVVELVGGALAQTPASGGGGAVDSVNGQTGVVVLDADDIGDGTTNKAYTATEKTKLAGIATGATANQSDATTNAAIALKADLASPALTGNPTAPTQTARNNSTRLATTAYVDTATASLNLPFTTGDYYSLSGGETASTAPALSPAGVLQAHPVYLQAGNYDRIAMYVATAAVSTYRLGVYPNNAATYKPDGQSLILDAGTLNMNAGTGIQQITVSLTIPTSGIYWLAVLCDSYTAKPSIVGWAGNSGQVPNLPYFGSNVYGSVAGRSPFACYATGVTTGAMPATFPTSTKGDTPPQITVRKA